MTSLSNDEMNALSGGMSAVCDFATGFAFVIAFAGPVGIAGAAALTVGIYYGC